VAPGTYTISDFYGLWTNFVVTTSEAGGTSLYINGNLLAHVSQSLTHTNNSAGNVLAIGTILSPSGNVPYSDINASYFVGALDNIFMYDTALTSSEVSTLYNAQRPSETGSSGGSTKSNAALIGAVVGAIGGTLLCCGLILLVYMGCYKQNPAKKEDVVSAMTYEAYPYVSEPTVGSAIEFSEGNLTLITAADVISATNNFSVAFLVGRGTSAEVYRAIMGGRPVAVKKLDIGVARSASLRQQQQLVHELNMCANYQHPNILPLLGVVTDPQCLCLVYPLQKLGTLADMLTKKRLTYLSDWRVRLCLGIDVATALDYLHTATSSKPCIVHRDVKLTNILVSEEADRLVAIVCDLGIAKVFQEGGTLGANTAVMGTLGYIDPQYAMGHILNKSSDIFALGVVLLQLLTGISEAFNRCEHPPALYLRLRPSLRTQSPAIAEPGVWPPEVAEYLGYFISMCTSDAIIDRPESCRTVAANLRAMIDIFSPIDQVSLKDRDSLRLRQRECIICFGETGPLDCRLAPCLHSCVCSKDAEILIQSKQVCPLCQVPIQSFELGQFEHTNTLQKYPF